MKYYPNNLEIIIQKIVSGEIASLLFYGPDSGMISDIIKKISHKLTYRVNNFEDISYNALFSAFNNQSFFVKREIVKINLKNSKFDAQIEELICAENIHLPIFIAEQLASSNSIRKLFEFKKNLAVIACYPDDEKSVRQIIVSIITENHKQLTPESLEYLINKLSGDRLLIINELEKLLCYVGDAQKITLNDCLSSISESIESHPDLLCLYFGKRKAAQYLKELDNLLENSVSVVWIIRALARFYQNLLIVKLQEADGVPMEVAINKLLPPVFFKILPPFKEIINNSSIRQVSDILQNLSIAEIDAKNGKGEIEVMDNLFIQHFL